MTDSASQIYQNLLPLTIIWAIDRELVNEEDLRRLSSAFAPYKPTATPHRIAVHESGHAIALLHFGITPSYMIVGDESESVVSADTTSLMDGETLEELIDYFAYKVAGQAAEEMVFGLAMNVEDGIPGRLYAVMQKLTSEECQAVIQSDTPVKLPNALRVQATLQLYLMAIARSHQILAPYKGAILELAALSEATKCLNSSQIDTFWKTLSVDT